MTDPAFSRESNDDTGDQQEGSVTATVIMPIDFRDGTYTAEGKSYEYYAAPAVYQGGQTMTTPVPKFIQITRTDWTGPISARAGGTGTYFARVRTSNSCATTATVEAGIGRPKGMSISWSVTGTLSQQVQHMFAAGESFDMTWTAQTGISNTVSGAIEGSSSFVSNSANCTQLPPDAASGYSLTKGTTVP